MLRRGGMRTADAGTFRILRALADSGLFQQGAVLVGTHAFATIGNMLGVHWANPSARTQDIDIARDNAVDLALPSSRAMNPPSVLDNLEMGFVPVPPLNRKIPSTSFKIRGQDLRVYLLTPSARSRSKPVYFDAINAAAQPLPFLDYIMEQPERTALVGRSAILVTVPDPARFALHKLCSSQVRAPAFQVNAATDLEQAAQLLEVLLEERPFDLESAWRAMQNHSRRLVRVFMDGLGQIGKLHPEIAESAGEMLKRIRKHGD